MLLLLCGLWPNNTLFAKSIENVKNNKNSVFINTPYTVCFTPKQNCTDLIVATINHATSSIDVQAYSFTSKPIINALQRASTRGVTVFVLLDKSNVTDQRDIIEALKHAGIPFLIDDKPDIAHNKVIIIDDQTVITGSFNFTYSAQHYNAENVLIIKDRSLAQQYLRNFNDRRTTSKDYDQYQHMLKYCKNWLAHHHHATNDWPYACKTVKFCLRKKTCG